MPAEFTPSVSRGAVLVGRGSEDQLQTEVLLRVRGRREGAARKFDPALGGTREEADASIARIRADLGAYGQYLHGHTPARHHRLWLDLIQALIGGRLTDEAVGRGLLPPEEGGRPRNKLLLLAPPASAKSSWVSIALPTWYLGNHPSHNVLFFTSSDPAANGFANTIKVILEQGKEHKEIFPDHPCRPHKARGWSTDGLFLHGTPMSGQSPAYRAVGFGASVMGQRANCLVGETRVETREGPRTIRELTERGSWVDVLSYSHERGCTEYRRARPHPKRTAHRLYEVILADGRVVRATAEHPFYVQGRGYVVASALEVGDALLDVRDVQPAVQSVALGAAGILFEGLLRSCPEHGAPGQRRRLRDVRRAVPAQTFAYDPFLLGGLLGQSDRPTASTADGNPDLFDLPEAVPPNLRRPHRTHRPAVLLKGLFRREHAQASRSLCGLRESDRLESCQGGSDLQQRVRRYVAPEAPPTVQAVRAAGGQTHQHLLWPGLPEPGPLDPSAGRGQQQIPGWTASRPLHDRLPRQRPPGGDRSGSCLPTLRHGSPPDRPPPERGQARQPFGEPAAAVQALSHQPSPDLVTEVHCLDIAEGVAVYNLEVDGNQNFFANGILTHNCLIIDDPMNQEDALSPNEQQKAKRYYDMTLARRLQPSEGVIVCVMTRWAEGDLASYFIEKAEAARDWLTVALPMVAEPDDPLGREPGELLWPEQFPRAWVERERLGMPPAEWNAIYQCSAAQMAGDVFSDERWIKPLPRDFHTPGKDGGSLRDSLMIVQGVDVAFSEKDSACFTVILTLGIDRNKVAYILDVHRARSTVKQTEDAIVDRILAYEPTAVGIEDSAFRHAVTAQLVHNIRQRVMVNIKAVAPRGMTKGPSDKVARARLPASRAEAGLMYADRSAAWWPSFIGELLAFPRGKTSDQVDALSLATYLGVTFQTSNRAPKRLVFTMH